MPSGPSYESEGTKQRVFVSKQMPTSGFIEKCRPSGNPDILGNAEVGMLARPIRSGFQARGSVHRKSLWRIGVVRRQRAAHLPSLSLAVRGTYMRAARPCASSTRLKCLSRCPYSISWATSSSHHDGGLEPTPISSQLSIWSAWEPARPSRKSRPFASRRRPCLRYFSKVGVSRRSAFLLRSNRES